MLIRRIVILATALHNGFEIVLRKCRSYSQTNVIISTNIFYSRGSSPVRGVTLQFTDTLQQLPLIVYPTTKRQLTP